LSESLLKTCRSSLPALLRLCDVSAICRMHELRSLSSLLLRIQAILAIFIIPMLKS
jgi:hypothetical protein